jgi:hypothetical protein
MVATPIPLGPFLVQESGHLELRRPDDAPSFTFMWRTRRFSVRIRRDRMSFSVPIGRLPSTSAGGGRREAAMGLLRALGRNLPAGWRMRLLPDHRIQIDLEQYMALPTYATALMTPVVSLVLRTAPLLDFMDECGLG